MRLSPIISPFCLVIFTLPPHSTSTLLCCYDVVLVSLTPVSRPCEREGVRRLRHSLGCFSTLVPWAEKAPPPLQPLSLRSPDPTSWYSGLCPCLPGTVLFSSPSHSLCLALFLLSHLLTSCLFSFGVLLNVFKTFWFKFFSSSNDFEFASTSWWSYIYAVTWFWSVGDSIFNITHCSGWCCFCCAAISF